MESKAARTTRYVVLAVFLCLTLGLAGLSLFGLTRFAGLQTGFIKQAITIGVTVGALIGAHSAWQGLYRCRRQACYWAERCSCQSAWRC